MSDAPPEVARPVTVIGAGGTIAMRGTHAAPTLDAHDLIATVPELAAAGDIRGYSVRNLPGAALGLDGALAVARAATAAAAGGRGVVVTSGTDTIEELAVLIDLMHGGPAPIVVTGAIRPASAPGADGPANLLHAAAVAAATEATGLGTVVVFGGQIHAPRFVRKADSTSPTAFASPQAGPIGYVEEGRVEILLRPPRHPSLSVAHLDARVAVVTSGLGDDGALLRIAAGSMDGLVLATLGAGHLPPAVMDAVESVSARVPVLATCRPERGAILHATYGFRGSEQDLRASGAIPAGRLSPVAARIALIAFLGSDTPAPQLRAVVAAWCR